MELINIKYFSNKILWLKNKRINKLKHNNFFLMSLNKISFICLIALLSNKGLFAQITTNELDGRVNTITTAVPFLMIAPDARGGSMGDAGVSSKPDANSFHWNPSKYAFVENDLGVALSYSPWLRALVPDINLAYLTGYKKLKKGQVIAAELRYFSLGDIIFTDIVGTDIGQFRPNEFSLAGSYSLKLSKNLSGGVALRYINSNLTGRTNVGGSKSHPGQSVSADLSMYYQKKIKIKKQVAYYAFGANISNIGAKMSYTESTERDFIPVNLRLGPTFFIEIDKYNTISVSVDLNKLLVPTPPQYDPLTNEIVKGKDPNVSLATGVFSSFSDAPGGFKEELREINYATGIEYWYDKQFAVRTGYFFEHATKGNRKYFTVGAGLKYNVFGIDFSYLIPFESHNPLENTLRFTLILDFAAFKEEVKSSISE